MKKILTLSLIAASFFMNAQDGSTEKKFSIEGSVDAYFQTNITAPDDQNVSFGTAFADQTGFAFGAGNLIASYKGATTGAVLDLITGPRGASATFSNDIIDGIVNQAYVYWNVSENTTITLGRFNTFLGYEVISPVSNFNYSTSHLFSNGPFSHLGVKADFQLSEDFSLMLAITNPWDTNNTSATGEYAFGAQLGYSGQFLNLYYDSGNNGGLGFEIDYTGGFDLSDKFYLGINAAYQTNEIADDINGGFYGAALYPQYTVSDAFAIGLRGEYFARHIEDVDDLPSVFATTLTGSYTVDNLIIKPEIRLDAWSNNDGVFIDNDSEAAESLAVFTLGAIYKF